MLVAPFQEHVIAEHLVYNRRSLIRDIINSKLKLQISPENLLPMKMKYVVSINFSFSANVKFGSSFSEVKQIQSLFTFHMYFNRTCNLILALTLCYKIILEAF